MSTPSPGSDGTTLHYGSADDPYEVIKIIDHYNLSFSEGNVLKYLLRHKKKDGLKDLKKAKFYLDRVVSNQEEKDKRVTVTPLDLTFIIIKGKSYGVRMFVFDWLTNKGNGIREVLEKLMGFHITQVEAEAIIAHFHLSPDTIPFMKVRGHIRP